MIYYWLAILIPGAIVALAVRYYGDPLNSERTRPDPPGPTVTHLALNEIVGDLLKLIPTLVGVAILLAGPVDLSGLMEGARITGAHPGMLWTTAATAAFIAANIGYTALVRRRPWLDDTHWKYDLAGDWDSRPEKSKAAYLSASYLSVTFGAGITEEILFRGVLLFAGTGALTPLIGAWPAVWVSLVAVAVAFACIHTQYPIGGKLVCLGMGLAFGVILLGTGSLVYAAVAHALMNTGTPWRPRRRREPLAEEAAA